MDITVTYSIVIPVKDERDNLRPLFSRVEATMNTMGKPWELVAIDDGSTDGSHEVLLSLCRDIPHFRLLTMEENYGQTAAFDAGFKAAKGLYIVTLDADGQNPPEEIPKLLEELEKGMDLVCGVRQRRRDRWAKRLVAHFANRVRRKICGDTAADSGCSLKAYKAESLRQLKLYHGMHRFLPSLFALEGLRIAEVPVKHCARQHGKSKYTLRNRNVNTILDLFAVWWMRKRHLLYAAREHDAPHL